MKNQSTRSVGLDIGKDSISVCIITEKGEEKNYKVSNKDENFTDLQKLLRKTDRVGMETGNLSFFISSLLQEKVGCSTYVLNANMLWNIIRSKAKTDKHDAREIAEVIETVSEDRLPIVNIPDETQIQMREVITEMSQLNKVRTQVINALHALFIKSGICSLKRTDLSTKEKRKQSIKRLPAKRQVRAQRLNEQITIFESQKAELLVEMEDLGFSVKENCEISMSMPGVAMQTAVAIHAFLGNFSNFSSRKQVASACGLAPKLHQSGKTTIRGSISKAGPRILRQLLVMAAWSIIRSKDTTKYKTIFTKIKASRGAKVAIVAVARHMIEDLYTMHKKKELFKFDKDDPQEKLSKKLASYKMKRWIE